MCSPVLRFATYLAPNMYPVYAFMVERIAQRLGVQATLDVGNCYDELSDGVDAAFICGLAYIELVRFGRADLEPIAAPILQGDRFTNQPVYYSDVIVRRDSSYYRFADLRGKSWSFNEPYSHSGYGVTLYRLLQLGETRGFFGRIVEAGWHERSIRLVTTGEVDASAIDCQVLAVTLREQPELATQIRIIDSFGPSTIQPLALSRRLPRGLRKEMLSVVMEMNEDIEARRHFAQGFIERFVPVSDDSYDDLRAMRAACEAAGFVTLR